MTRVTGSNPAPRAIFCAVVAHKGRAADLHSEGMWVRSPSGTPVKASELKKILDKILERGRNPDIFVGIKNIPLVMDDNSINDTFIAKVNGFEEFDLQADKIFHEEICLVLKSDGPYLIP